MAPDRSAVQIDYGHFSSQTAIAGGFPPISNSNVGTVVVKNNWSMGDLFHEHGRQWEAVCFYPLEEHEFEKRIPDVINVNRTGNNLHPTEKPVDLMQQIILANKCETVLDPFIGSGTTAVACQNLHRKFIGIEISPEYCEIARQRLRQQPLI